MSSEFRVRPNLPVGVFLVAYIGYSIYYVIGNIASDLAGSMALIISSIVFAIYFLGCRPYKYVIEKKTIYTYRRVLKTKELDLMQCANITDPVVKLTKWTSTPHAIEIYTDKNKRYSFYPKDRVAFTGATLRENKRLHCTVKDYTDIHRKLAKRQRKERKRNQKED